MDFPYDIVVWLFIAGLLSFFLTGLVRHYALAKSHLDIPNSRSSHTVPTPSSGGIGFVITILLGISIFGFISESAIQITDLLQVLIIGGFVIAGVGLIDDYRHVSAKWRILVQGIIAFYTVIVLGIPEINVFVTLFEPHILFEIIFIIGMVWLINLYNFMDGIDGLAGTETLFVSSAALLLLIGAGYFYPVVQSENNHEYLILLLLVLSASIFGFLLWNWPPAKIFMGDVGSSYLGFMFGVLLIYTSVATTLNIWTWLILLGIFIIDATITLIQRFISGEKWYSAHRSHAYQNAARQWDSHRKVTLSILTINIVWLFPLAWLATIKPEWGVVFTTLAYLPLFALTIYLKAGKVPISDEQS